MRWMVSIKSQPCREERRLVRMDADERGKVEGRETEEVCAG